MHLCKQTIANRSDILSIPSLFIQFLKQATCNLFFVWFFFSYLGTSFCRIEFFSVRVLVVLTYTATLNVTFLIFKQFRHCKIHHKTYLVGKTYFQTWTFSRCFKLSDNENYTSIFGQCVHTCSSIVNHLKISRVKCWEKGETKVIFHLNICLFEDFPIN